MSTPRSKPLIRYGRTPKGWKKVPDGHYVMGLRNDNFTLAVGQIVTFYPLLERGMSELMAELIGGVDPPVQQIFYSINNQQARIKVLRSLLQEAQINENKDGSYDQMIDDFASIGKSRSDYAHGIWWTHDSKRVFLAEPDPSIFSYFGRREVNLTELENVILRMNDLAIRLKTVSIRRLEKIARSHVPPQADASPHKPPPPPVEGSA